MYVILAAAGMLLAMGVSAQAAAPLADLQWKSRVVLIFGAGENADVQRQIADFRADPEALSDRDLVVLHVDGRKVEAVSGPAGKASGDSLRASFGIDADSPFTVILIGKDGGEKLRRRAPVPPRDIFGLIDSMPMRRSEMSKG